MDNLVSTLWDFMFVKCGRKQAEYHVIKGRKHIEKKAMPSSFVLLTAPKVLDLLR